MADSMANRIVGMTRVVFMCGPAGSGKSTVARELQSGGMARLSFDEEAWLRGIHSQPVAEEVRLEIESHLA
jgi:adenylate kinase family enzyme